MGDILYEYFFTCKNLKLLVNLSNSQDEIRANYAPLLVIYGNVQCRIEIVFLYIYILICCILVTNNFRFQKIRIARDQILNVHLFVFTVITAFVIKLQKQIELICAKLWNSLNFTKMSMKLQKNQRFLGDFLKNINKILI